MHPLTESQFTKSSEFCREKRDAVFHALHCNVSFRSSFPRTHFRSSHQEMHIHKRLVYMSFHESARQEMDRHSFQVFSPWLRSSHEVCLESPVRSPEDWEHQSRLSRHLLQEREMQSRVKERNGRGGWRSHWTRLTAGKRKSFSWIDTWQTFFFSRVLLFLPPLLSFFHPLIKTVASTSTYDPTSFLISIHTSLSLLD